LERPAGTEGRNDFGPRLNRGSSGLLESRGGGGGWGAGAGGVVLLCVRARLGTTGGLPGGQVPERPP
jgi:hypothetical protein